MKYVDILELFCLATALLEGERYVSSSCVLPLLSSLTKHLIVHDDDPGYIARFKAATLGDSQARVNGMNGIEIMRIATALDPRYKSLRCLSEEAKCQIWTAVHKRMPAASDAGQSHVSASVVRDTVREPAIKRPKLMELDSDTDDIVETASDEVGRYKLDKKLGDDENPLLW